MKYTFAVLLLIAGTAQAQSDDSLLKGLLRGCLDGQVRLLGHEPDNDEKRRILHFCHCKAGNMVPLASDRETVRKLQLGDPKVTAAVKKIDAICIQAVNDGVRFAPGLTR